MPSIPEKVTAIGYADGSNPFIPATDTNYVFRKEFLREVLAYLK
ncbi:CbbQ/NirQ/NorQ/GpvN family protein, partial [Salmonella enterica subsp. enterica serovar Typhimurium]|nr:CbbQ/NirQ/NorQ/GpvN family protein [Salmonella enterica]EDN7262060.1 CbbQ/NirQ/NorQ/GpvN family protein [Salmonella enterica subsp. enterica serovar Typhimurium]EED3261560.1 CbbQ/NirQ/NorQ/GpvN family protein [Salmonella enterica subsp. enterica]EED3403328.1 CbbQ/NirQ/NorQ/GpvN family protein [Salmonella enterica subsp. enterica]EEJ8342919.1 CbbQ/NirQ/NorQ/GpvN family protein [Salmonella enterica subsp. enterica]